MMAGSQDARPSPVNQLASLLALVLLAYSAAAIHYTEIDLCHKFAEKNVIPAILRPYTSWPVCRVGPWYYHYLKAHELICQMRDPPDADHVFSQCKDIGFKTIDFRPVPGSTTSPAAGARSGCEPNPCASGGTCIERPGGHKCLCLPGYKPWTDCRERCDLGENWGTNCSQACGACAPVYPRDPRLASRPGARVVCHPARGCLKCQDGARSPPYCNRVVCSASPCYHNARCFAEKCHCTGTTGIFCQTRLLAQSIPASSLCDARDDKCLNGGRCLYDSRGRPVCLCDLPYAGPRCQSKCLKWSDNCRHGDCYKNTDWCHCAPGYASPYCTSRCPVGTFTFPSGECQPCGRCKVFPCDVSIGVCEGGLCESELYEPQMCTARKRKLPQTQPDRDVRPRLEPTTPRPPQGPAARVAGSFQALPSASYILNKTSRTIVVGNSVLFVQTYVVVNIFNLSSVPNPVHNVAVNLNPGSSQARPGTRGHSTYQPALRPSRTRGHNAYQPALRQKARPPVLVMFSLDVTISAVAGLDLAAVVTQNLRQHADQFDGGGLVELDAASIRVTNVDLGQAGSVERADRAAPGMATVAAWCLALVFSVVIVGMIVVKRGKSSTQQRNITQGAVVPGHHKQPSRHQARHPYPLHPTARPGLRVPYPAYPPRQRTQ